MSTVNYKRELAPDEPRPKPYSAVDNQMTHGSPSGYKSYKRKMTQNTTFSVTFNGMTIDELVDLFQKVDPAWQPEVIAEPDTPQDSSSQGIASWQGQGLPGA